MVHVKSHKAKSSSSQVYHVLSKEKNRLFCDGAENNTVVATEDSKNFEYTKFWLICPKVKAKLKLYQTNKPAHDRVCTHQLVFCNRVLFWSVCDITAPSFQLDHYGTADMVLNIMALGQLDARNIMTLHTSYYSDTRWAHRGPPFCRGGRA